MLVAVSAAISMPTMPTHNAGVPDLDPMPQTAPTTMQTRMAVVGTSTAAHSRSIGGHRRVLSPGHLLPRGSTLPCHNSTRAQTIKVPDHHGRKARADLLQMATAPTTVLLKDMWQANSMAVAATDGLISRGGRPPRATLTASGCNNSAANALMN